MKPIMINETQKQEIMLKFEKYISEFKSNTSMLNFSMKLNDVIGIKAKLPTVKFSKLAYEKIKYLIDKTDSEIAWHGVVTKNKNLYTIEDILIYPQNVTAATVTTNDEKYTKWLNAIHDNIFNKLRMQGHSHVNMGVHPSSTDTNYYNLLLQNLSAKNNDYYIFMIMNKKGDVFINIYDFEQNLIFEDDDITLKTEGSTYTTWYKDSMKNITSTKAVITTYGGYKADDFKKYNPYTGQYTEYEDNEPRGHAPGWHGGKYGYK